MDNSILKQLLTEYEQKRNKAIVFAEASKKNFLLNEYKLKYVELIKEKENILKKLGKSSNEFEPAFECRFCNDTGYVLKNNNYIMCSCLKQKILNIEYNKSNIGNLNKENFKTFDISKYSDEINSLKYKSDISPRQNILIIKDICMNFINNFDNPEEKNLLFTGNTGLRKNFPFKLYCQRNIRKRQNCFISNFASYVR